MRRKDFTKMENHLKTLYVQKYDTTQGQKEI